jgi:hypothetical protein
LNHAGCRWAEVKIYIFLKIELRTGNAAEVTFLEPNRRQQKNYSLYGSALKGLFHDLDLDFDDKYG